MVSNMRVDVGLARHVALDRDARAGPRPCTAATTASAAAFVVTQIVDRDVVALRRRKLRGRGADAAARAGNQQNLAH